MRIPQSYSQAKQDQFVFDLLVKSRTSPGYFLDIGSSDPINLSNSYALELIGWTGYMMDNNLAVVHEAQKIRKNPVIFADATTYDFNILPKKAFDYLSLDVDDGTQTTLEHLLAAGIEFRAGTIEHDAYRLGDGPRAAMRKMLEDRGYKLLLGDISVTPGHPFEDWWIHSSIASIMFDLTPYLSADTTILPAKPCASCRQRTSP